MPKTDLSWLRHLFIPGVVLAVLFVAFSSFYMYWVPSRQRHLDDRAFRYLNTLSEQIRLTITTYDKMLDNAVDADISSPVLPNYLKQVAPQLVVPDRSEREHAVGEDYSDPPKIAVEADEGTHLLYLAFQRAKSSKACTSYVVQTDLDKLINGLLGPQSLNPFDVVLIARGNGKVIFQKSLSGIEVAEVKNLEDVSGQTQSNTPTPIDISTLLPTSHLEEVRIAGARYRLYGQPVSIGFLPARPNRDRGNASTKGESNSLAATANHSKNRVDVLDADSVPCFDRSVTEDAEADSEDWLLCGLVRADRFRSESQLIPYSYILAILALILLSAASYPYARIFLSLPGERLRARDVAVTGVFTCLIASIVCFIVTDIYFWNRIFGPNADNEMASLARAINNNFEIEQRVAFEELAAFNNSAHPSVVLPDVSRQLRSLNRETVALFYGDGDEHSETCRPSQACKVDILVAQDIVTDKRLFGALKAYPYPFFAFWSDVKGNQRMKWTTRRRATPFVTLDDTSIPFYPEVARALKRPAHSDGVPTRGIGSQYSPTTGQNITTFWTVPKDPDSSGSKVSDDDVRKARYCAALVTQPISVYNSVLPGGYQFAVITPDGTVVFHSDPTRNLRENFLAETDLNPDLHSRLRIRAEGTVTANYMDRPYRMYVLPMQASNQDGPLTIVVFRDLHIEEVMNLEILSLVSILFLLYTAVIVPIMFFVYWGRKDVSRRSWFWPDSSKGGIYRHLAVVNLVSMVVVFLLSRWLSGLAILVVVLLASAGVIVLNMLFLSRGQDSEVSTSRPAQNSRDWRSSYYLAMATLVMTMAVIPCLCFFQVSAAFEQRLFTQHTVLQLAADLDIRDLAMRALYQDVKMGDFQTTVLGQHSLSFDSQSGQNVQETPVFSYHELLQVSFTNPTRPSSSLSRLDNAFLSSISYPYNERALDDRHLAEGKSDVNLWSFWRDHGENVLGLTQHRTTGPDRIISVKWRPFHILGRDWIWWFGIVTLLLGIYLLVRLSTTAIFLLDLITPSPAQEAAPGMNAATLIADLPMNLLLIGHETALPISRLLHRSDVQIHDTSELQQGIASPKPTTEAGFSRPTPNPLDAMIRDGRPLVLRNFERLSDDGELPVRAYAALNRLVSALDNSVILVSSMDPILIPSIESSDLWRNLLRSFVRIDLNTIPHQHVGEDDAEYQSRISAQSYFHWLFAGLPKLDKLIMLQLAQETIVNPSDNGVIEGLLEEGLVERKRGLLTVKDPGFAEFAKRALPHHVIKQWEKEITGSRPFSLQTSLMIIGIGVVAFLVYTQGDVFNTWVTYATGVASAAPKMLQLFDNLRSKTGAASE